MTEIRPIFQRSLPKGLEGLYELAFDLRWTGGQITDRIWEMLDPEAWERTNNPYMILENVSQERLEEAARDDALKEELRSVLERRQRSLTETSWFELNCSNSSLKTVAYFSMEFGLSEALPIYSGGLGILAGDLLKTASDMGIPMVGVGLLYQQGYFRQILASDGTQVEAFPYNDPTSLPIVPVQKQDGSWLRITIQLPGRALILRVWRAQVGRIDLYLLDSNDPLNSPWDRGITAALYSPGQEKRLIQEIVLGIGGWRALEEMGIEVDVCHLNEGHASFAILARAYSFIKKTGQSFPVALWATRAGNIFTTHTPVAAGFDCFDQSLIRQYAQYYAEMVGISLEEFLALQEMGIHDALVTANLAMRGCCHVNGVSSLHGQVSRRIFQHLFPRWPQVEVPVGHVTNGVHIPSWDSPEARRFWDMTIGEYHWTAAAGEPWDDIFKVSDNDLWSFRFEAKKSLVEYVRRRLVRQLKEHNAPPDLIYRAEGILDPNYLTIGLARRFAAYKRPTLLLHDLERLEAILLNKTRPVQILVAGKAHPSDEEGKQLVRTMIQFASKPELFDRVVFLEDYDIALARRLEPGVDLWINVPRRPMEACGTSGMKVLVNGGLNLSELDGWWAEAYSPEVGWAIGDGREHDDPGWDAIEAEQLYRILDDEVIPEFYDRDEEGIPRAWIKRVRESMGRLTPRFSSHRMMREYVEKAYLPASDDYKRRSAGGAKLASDLNDWKQKLDKGWMGLRFGDLKFETDGESWRFEVQVYLNGLDPEDVVVELYADPLQDGGPVRKVMVLNKSIPESFDGYIYTGEVPASRPAEDFTPRIIPHNPDAFVPLEVAYICWQR